MAAVHRADPHAERRVLAKLLALDNENRVRPEPCYRSALKGSDVFIGAPKDTDDMDDDPVPTCANSTASEGTSVQVCASIIESEYYDQVFCAGMYGNYGVYADTLANIVWSTPVPETGNDVYSEGEYRIDYTDDDSSSRSSSDYDNDSECSCGCADEPLDYDGLDEEEGEADESASPASQAAALDSTTTPEDEPDEGADKDLAYDAPASPPSEERRAHKREREHDDVVAASLDVSASLLLDEAAVYTPKIVVTSTDIDMYGTLQVSEKVKTMLDQTTSIFGQDAITGFKTYFGTMCSTHSKSRVYETATCPAGTRCLMCGQEDSLRHLRCATIDFRGRMYFNWALDVCYDCLPNGDWYNPKPASKKYKR